MKKYMKIFMVFLIVCAVLAGCSGGGESYRQESQEIEDDKVQSDFEDSAQPLQGVAGGQKNALSEEMADGEEVAEGAGQGQNETVSQDQNQPQDPETGTDQKEGGDQAQTAKKEEKLVYTCDLTIETTSYQKTMEEIEKQIKDFSGIIESENEYDNDSGWYIDGHTKTYGTMECTIVVRIPSKDYQAFLKALDGKGKMTHKSMDVQNISRSYYDTQATIESLNIQEKRLLKMMDEAKTIEDMITVEKRLTEVQTQLNQYKTRLSMMDTQVAYSTITMNIKEVLEYKPSPTGKKTNTFLERLSNTLQESWTGFLSFMEELLFLIIRLLPFIVVFGLIWWAARPLRVRFRQRRQAKKAAREAQAGRQEKKGNNGRLRFSKKKTEAPEPEEIKPEETEPEEMKPEEIRTEETEPEDNDPTP